MPELFNFHSKDWWRHLWEKTGLVEITACYDMDDPKEVWRPWADWSIDNFAREWGGDGEFDTKFLNADTNDDLALIVISATKKQ